MPFGEKCQYKDFDDCVRQSAGMEDPEGYCARIKEATEAQCAERALMRRNSLAIANFKMRLLDRIANLDPALASGLRELQLGWYYIRNAAEDDDEAEDTKAEVFIYDEIGGSFGVSADEFVKELNGIKAKEIDVRINSPGGSLFDSIAIHNALVKHPATITTYVDALAASGASIVAMAGDEVVMMLGSQLMIHDALGAEMGNAADFREMADFLDKQSDNIAGIYANKAGGEMTIEDWRAMMLAESWMFANEAIDLGLADRVYKPPPKGEVEEEDEEDAEAEEGEELPEEEMEGDEEEEGEPSEEELDALMHAPHRLRNRGYKYPGRSKAPDPRIYRNVKMARSHTRPRTDAWDAVRELYGQGR